MMSTKQLACMLTLHIIYLLLGASIFYHIESPVEMAQRGEEKLERLEIQNLLYENYIPTDPDKQDSILRKLSDYCGKSMFNYTTEDEEPPIKWDFYHSFFFSYTVVSTIGYGNLSPTTHLSRILMIFYGLFGIPINGILLANLGEYFGLQLITVYRKYKRKSERRADMLDYFFHNLGMLGQIFIYLVPGFLFFIFLPACIFMVFEGWDYVASIYYAFVTLTTIGFGDLVAGSNSACTVVCSYRGTVNNGFASGYFIIYQLFLIVWITFGLGYIVMLLGFITSGMRSESVHKIEQKIANQMKSAQNRLLKGFTGDIAIIRKIINEANLIKIKPVYIETAPYLYRSKSCPTLTFDVEPRDPIVKRKRANSENITLSTKDILRIQSDTDLLGIDKEKTFTASAIVRPAELLARVVNVLGGIEQPKQEKGVHMFNDDEILSSEKPGLWTIGQDSIIDHSPKRNRASSVAVPNYRKESVSKIDHDFTWTNGDSGEKFREAINQRVGKLSLPASANVILTDKETEPQPKSILSKFFRKQSSTENPAEYLKSTMKGRVSNQAQEKPKRRGSIFPSFGFGDNEKTEAAQYQEKTKQGRGSIFPTFGQQNSDDSDDMARAYREKTKKGRHSIFPTFDFSEDEDAAAIRAYREKSKRHSIFPTFNFDEEDDDDDKAAKAYREKTSRGRHSIFPTFDFSESEDDHAKKYKESTRKGRHSIFPTFDFSYKKDDDDDDDTIDEEEVRKYQNRTERGRMSLFPTFGKHKKNKEDDTIPENSEELKRYQNKTKKGRGSLFPSFGKDRNNSNSLDSQDDPISDMEADIRKYQSQTKRGRNSLFSGDIQKYKSSSQGGRGSLTGGDLEEYKNKTKRGRPSLFDANLAEEDQAEALEQTSVADLLRALTVLEAVSPSSRRGSSDSVGILDLIAGAAEASAPPLQNRRRGSIRPDFIMPSIPSRIEAKPELTAPRQRRVSARAAAPQFTPTLATVMAGAELQTTAASSRENRMNMLNNPPPPPYSEATSEEDTQGPRVRRYSPAPTNTGRSSSGPVPRLFSRIRKESVNSIEEEESTSRRGSLTDVVIDSNKDSKDNT